MDRIAEVRVRFAPSPTGNFHIGNARTALFNWLFARKNNGKLILRIEDTDLERSKDEYVESIHSHLKWMGINWDEGLDKGGEYGPYKQSDRVKFHRQALDELIQKNKVYPCFCHPEDLDKKRQECLKRGEMPRYDRTCRNKDILEVKELMKQKKEYVWRFAVPNNEVIEFYDRIKGDVRVESEYISDFVVARSDESIIFHLAVTVDDALMKVTHIIRGDDHLSNTPKHVLLFKALNYALPEFAHLPMIIGEDGKKMSKRDGSGTLQTYIDKGYLPHAFVNYLALLGWSPGNDIEYFTMGELIQSFSFTGVSKSPAMFDQNKLNWMNKRYLQSESTEELIDKACLVLREENLIKAVPSDEEEFEFCRKVFELMKGNIVTLSDFPSEAEIFFQDDIYYNPECIDYLKNSEKAEELVSSIIKNLSLEEAWDEETCQKVLDQSRQDCGLKGKHFFMPSRKAITGREKGPELYKMMNLLGKDKILRSLSNLLNILQEK